MALERGGVRELRRGAQAVGRKGRTPTRKTTKRTGRGGGVGGRGEGDRQEGGGDG